MRERYLTSKISQGLGLLSRRLPTIVRAACVVLIVSAPNRASLFVATPTRAGPGNGAEFVAAIGVASEFTFARKNIHTGAPRPMTSSAQINASSLDDLRFTEIQRHARGSSILESVIGSPSPSESSMENRTSTP